MPDYYITQSTLPISNMSIGPIVNTPTGIYITSSGGPGGIGVIGSSGGSGWHDPVQEQLHNLTNRILELEYEIRLHDKYPALKEAWEQYQVLKILCLSDEQTEGNSGV